jgi:hypothetical protein
LVDGKAVSKAVPTAGVLAERMAAMTVCQKAETKAEW